VPHANPRTAERGLGGDVELALGPRDRMQGIGDTGSPFAGEKRPWGRRGILVPMLDPQARPHCPACGADGLRSIGLAGPGAIWSCRSCRGIFARVETVARMGRTHGDGHPLLRVGRGPARCRSCKSVLQPGAACPTCNSQLITCVGCTQTMERIAVERLTIDVCRPCRSVWLDQGELGELVAISRHRATFAAAEGSPRNDGTSPGRKDARRDVASWIDLPVVFDPGPLVSDVIEPGIALGHTAVEAAAGLPDLAAGAGEAAITAVHATGQAAAEGASWAGSALLELLGGLFDGL
jgi:Zn-finger nucleic acid-binding protein